MRLLASAPNGTQAINSDAAFWGNKAFVGNYDGFRIFDISNPSQPVLITDFRCYGPQNDLSVYDRNGDGEADLLIASVDRTLTGPACGSAATLNHDDPGGWEGLRIFDISNLAAPVLLATVYQDCGSHTHTLIPQPERGRLLVLNSSYPLRPGPTCGPVRGPQAKRDPLHGVIQVVEIPLAAPAAAFELTELPINYPGDPDNKFDPAEHGLEGLDSLRACHDIAVFMPLGLVAGACAEQAQMWRIDPISGLPDTVRPLWVYHDSVDSDGAGGGDVAVDFWHSATFSWDGRTVIFIDESLGTGCPTTTPIKGVASDTGRMFFLKAATGEKLSHYFIEREPQADDPVQYCSAHLGNTVPSYGRDLLVNAWYTGGVDVIDFTNPRKPREIAFYDVRGDNWSAYWYEHGHGFDIGPMNIYGTHGVEVPADGLGFQSFEAYTATLRVRVRGLNPQTQEFMLK
ncbi:secreted protein [Caldimonas brevitalea]|uniref:Secreted protein n=2 Tax=Caldimonas brevitalea TaxID=413882 RepID=A0A0G3BRU0_9BURK|nr:secreted protein [Caldimonas brevitalea]